MSMRLSIRISEKEKALLQEECLKTNLSLSEVIRKLIVTLRPQMA